MCAKRERKHDEIKKRRVCMRAHARAVPVAAGEKGEAAAALHLCVYSRAVSPPPPF